MARRVASAALAVLCLPATLHADAIDDYVSSEMKRLQIPEVAYVVLKNGEAIKSAALGFSDREAKREAKIDDVFEIGSLTKQFTAMGVLMLVESGRVNLDDPISKYLSDVPVGWAPIKVRNLLNQDSGLPEYVTVKGLSLLDKFTRAQFLAALGKLPVDFQPGEAWAYSNSNYALLGWLIEDVTKESYTKFIEENILRPLGMNHTLFAETGVTPPGLVKGYLVRRVGGVVPSPRGAASIKSDGGLISNLADLTKWDEALGGLRLISRPAYAELWGRVKLNSGRIHPYGMGFYLNMPGSVVYLGHGGNSAGYSAGFSRFPGKQLTVILLANIYPLAAESMCKHIASLYDSSLQGPTFISVVDPDIKRTDRVRLAIAALAANKPDPELMEPEEAIPMRTMRGRRAGAGPWGSLTTIDKIEYGGQLAQGADKLLMYRITSADQTFIAIILWSNKDKLAGGSLYPQAPPGPAKS